MTQTSRPVLDLCPWRGCRQSTPSPPGHTTQLPVSSGGGVERSRHFLDLKVGTMPASSQAEQGELADAFCPTYVALRSVDMKGGLACVESTATWKSVAWALRSPTAIWLSSPPSGRTTSEGRFRTADDRAGGHIDGCEHTPREGTARGIQSRRGGCTQSWQPLNSANHSGLTTTILAGP